jgi:pimeloyl-ACP methyl ester carboxylesterase
MYFKKLIIILILFLFILFSYELKVENKNGNEIIADSSGYIEIKKVKLYFEIHGEGTPLLYLHGGLSSSLDFSKYIPELSKHFKVITFDRKGHGRSSDDDEIFSYASMAEYTNLFLDKIGISKAFVIGWSDGGVVGYHLASKYPFKVIKLIAVGANYLVEGMTELSIEWIKNQMTVEEISRTYPSVESDFKKLNPEPNNFQNFIAKTREMWLRNPYISNEDFVKINVPVLLIAGDRDDIRLEHMFEMYSLLKKSQLCILPNTTHFVFDEYNDTVAKILSEFLKQAD